MIDIEDVASSEKSTVTPRNRDQVGTAASENNIAESYGPIPPVSQTKTSSIGEKKVLAPEKKKEEMD